MDFVLMLSEGLEKASEKTVSYSSLKTNCFWKGYLILCQINQKHLVSRLGSLLTNGKKCEMSVEKRSDSNTHESLFLYEKPRKVHSYFFIYLILQTVQYSYSTWNSLPLMLHLLPTALFPMFFSHLRLLFSAAMGSGAPLNIFP